MRKIIVLLCLAWACVAVGQEPDNVKVAAFFQDQQFDEALVYLKPFDNEQTQDLRVLGYIAYANYMLENEKVARNYYERIVNIDPNNISALRYLASITADRSPDTSIFLGRRLIALKPDVAAFYRHIGENFRRINRQDSALGYFNTAYNLLPTDPKNAAALADILITNKSYTRADSILSEGLKRDSMNASYLRLSVRSAYQAEDYKNVIIPGERIMRTEEISSAPLIQLALAYYNLRQYRASYRVCQFLLDNGFELEAIYYYQAKAASKLKEFEKSNELLGICVNKAISETAEMYYYNLGQNYEATKQFKKAIAQYDTAYFLFRDPLMMYYVAGVYETGVKDMTQARKYYAKFLALAHPANENEKKAIQYVRDRLKEPERLPRRDQDSTALKE